MDFALPCPAAQAAVTDYQECMSVRLRPDTKISDEARSFQCLAYYQKVTSAAWRVLFA